MPLIKSKSKKAFQKNMEAEMSAGKPQKQSLAIAYSVKRKSKKAAGGSVASGSRDMNMADGGAISAKSEKRPMPNDLHDDQVMESHNRSKKALIDDQWSDNPTVKQSQSNNGRMVKPIKSPRMVGSDAFSVRSRDMHDDEANMGNRLPPESDLAQPVKRDDERDAKKMGKGPDMAQQHDNGKSPYNKAIEDQYSQDIAQANMKKAQSYAEGGPVMEPEDHDEQLMERRDESDLMDDESPSEDEGDDEARSLNEEGPDRDGPESVDLYMKRMAEGGHIGRSQDNYDDDGHEDSIVSAIMANRDRLHKEIESGAHDLDAAARYAEGGQVDLSQNADEEPNNEDQMSFGALKKENYSESEGLDELDQPEDSNESGDDREDESENKHDRVSSIRSKMMARRQFKAR
jgi:hypothetical protein